MWRPIQTQTDTLMHQNTSLYTHTPVFPPGLHLCDSQSLSEAVREEFSGGLSLPALLIHPLMQLQDELWETSCRHSPCVTENKKLDPACTKQGSHRSDALPLKHVVLFPGSSSEGLASTFQTSPEFSRVHPTPAERVVDRHGEMKAGKGSMPCCSFQSIDSNTGTRRKTSTRWIPNLLDPSSPSELPSPCFYTFPLKD